MDKNILNQYIDACELIKETEEEILKLENMQAQITRDSVMGSNPDFPYQPRHFKIEGVTFDSGSLSRLYRQQAILMQRRQRAEEIKEKAEEWMLTLSPRMQRIIRYHFFDRYTWKETARRMGRKATADSVRKEFENFIKTEK